MNVQILTAALLAAAAASCGGQPTPHSDPSPAEAAPTESSPAAPPARTLAAPPAETQGSADAWSVGDTSPSGQSGVPDIEILEVRGNGTGPACGMGKTATLAYKAMKANGEVLDPGSRPFTFKVGSGMAIVGWDKVVSRMRVGDSFVILLPEALAYRGRGDLKFEMELLSVK